VNPDPGEVAATVDSKLAQLNVEYQGKRESQRLEGVVVHWLCRHTGENYKQHCVKQGQREGQFKTIALAYRRTFGFDLGAFVVRSDP
jgi:hypothetical protein